MKFLKTIFFFRKYLIIFIQFLLHLSCNHSDLLTEKEKDWLKEHPNLVVGLSPNAPPYQFINEKGEEVGIFIDFLAIIENRINYKFKKVYQSNFPKLLNDVKEGTVDVILEIQKTDARQEFLNFTPFLLSHKHVIVVRHTEQNTISIGDLKDKKIAVANMYAVQEFLEKNYPDYSIIPLFDDVTCLRAVSTRQADAFISQQAVATYYIETEGISNLKIAGEIDYSNELAIASRKELDTLHSILTKAVNSISKTEKQTIYSNWLSFEVKPFYRESRFWIIVVILFFVSLLFIGIFNIILQKRVKQKTKELVSAEKEALVRENELRTILSKMPIAIALTDEKFSITFRNEQFIKLFGYTEEDVPTVAEWWPLAYPDEQDRKWAMETWGNEVQKAIKNGTDVEPHEYPVTCKDGSLCFVEISGISLGRNILTTFIDVTERKLSEKALLENEQKLHLISETIPNIIWTGLPDGYIDYCNKNWLNFTGMTQEEIQGNGWMKALHPDDVDHTSQVWLDACKQGEIYEVEQRLRKHDGEYHWFLTRALPLKNADGSIIKWYGSNTDISERKKAEDKLKEKQLQLQAILDYSPALISIKDLNGTIILANRSFTTLDAPPLNEFIGKSVFDVFPEEVAEQLWKNDLAALEKRVPIYSEEVVKHKDDIWHTYLTVKFPIYLNENLPFGICAISNDITDRINSEKKILQSLREKEILIQELYHRTKNTLQVIRGLLLLQATEFPDNTELQKLVADTEKRIMAISLVHQMLYKKQDLSKISIKEYIQDLSTLILDSFSTVKDRISLNIEIIDQYFLLDIAIPFGLIINELMTNSLKYGFPDNTKGNISIKLKYIEPDKYQLEYSDNGVGVPADFNFRKQSTLGLSLIYNIGETQMRGNILLESKEGVSCLFEFPTTLYKARV